MEIFENFYKDMCCIMQSSFVRSDKIIGKGSKGACTNVRDVNKTLEAASFEEDGVDLSRGAGPGWLAHPSSGRDRTARSHRNISGPLLLWAQVAESDKVFQANSRMPAGTAIQSSPWGL